MEFSILQFPKNRAFSKGFLCWGPFMKDPIIWVHIKCGSLLETPKKKKFLFLLLGLAWVLFWRAWDALGRSQVDSVSLIAHLNHWRYSQIGLDSMSTLHRRKLAKRVLNANPKAKVPKYR